MAFKPRNKWLAYERSVEENNRDNTMQRFNYRRKEAGKGGNKYQRWDFDESIDEMSKSKEITEKARFLT